MKQSLVHEITSQILKCNREDGTQYSYQSPFSCSSQLKGTEFYAMRNCEDYIEEEITRLVGD